MTATRTGAAGAHPTSGTGTTRRLTTALLDLMDSDREYEIAELHAMFANTSRDSLREALHTLWIDRRVERVGLTGWRRHESR